ncbi:MAG: hypothetical protein IKU40_05585, partial [Clostridia bacterium]|nr:hypothetical protein [Clostridia bacterium]
AIRESPLQMYDISSQTHQKFFSQTHISPTNRQQQIEVFAELFSKSDRSPFPDALHFPESQENSSRNFL